MKFTKRRTDINGTTTGDFDTFDASVLQALLINLLGEQGNPQRQYLNTNDNEIDVVQVDPTLDMSGVVGVISNYTELAAELVSITDPSLQEVIDSLVSYVAKQVDAPQLIKDRNTVILKVKL